MNASCLIGCIVATIVTAFALLFTTLMRKSDPRGRLIGGLQFCMWSAEVVILLAVSGAIAVAGPNGAWAAVVSYVVVRGLAIGVEYLKDNGWFASFSQNG